MIAATSARRAGFVSRLTAFIADAVVLVLALRGTLWFLIATGHALRSFVRQKELTAIVGAALPLVAATYLVIFWRLFGQTPGKWLMGIKVVPDGGGVMTVRRALRRFLGYLLSALPFYAGFLWILGPQRRAWHDRIAGTEVIYLARPPEIPARPVAGPDRALSPVISDT